MSVEQSGTLASGYLSSSASASSLTRAPTCKWNSALERSDSLPVSNRSSHIQTSPTEEEDARLRFSPTEGPSPRHADVHALAPVYAPIRGCNFRSKRVTELSIEDDLPLQLSSSNQEVELQACTEPILKATTAAAYAVPPSAEALMQRYRRCYDSSVEASFHYVVAIVNPSSGEKGLAEVVLGALRDELGRRRILTLCGDTFADSAPLRLFIKQQAVIYRTPGHPPPQQRGTVVVCGGDGTISFLMSQLNQVRQELEEEFLPFVSESQVREMHSGSAGAASATLGEADEQTHPFFILPALAPFPLGTGNDFSNCVGFGSGFSTSGKTLWWLGGWCGCGDDAGEQVATALRRAVSAPSVSFDQWEVSLVPLRIAQAAVRPEPSRAPRHSTREVSSISSEDLRSPLWNRPLRCGSVADAVNLVDWAKVHARGQCVRYNVINYIGIGYDAYVAHKFDATRRAHPYVCSTRNSNKAVYGMMGMRGAFRCKKLRDLIPMVCVPLRQLRVPREGNSSGGDGSNTDGGAVPATARQATERSYVALQIPASAKALVLTNVSSYSGGTHPWNVQSGTLCYHPVTLRNREIVPAAGAFLGNRTGDPSSPPLPRPVAINDRAFELQAMGGVLHYTSLSLGLHSATKIAQTDEAFIFVLCTPEDLHFPSGQCSSFSYVNLKSRYAVHIESDAGLQASLNLQIDGEAMPRISEPTIVHIRQRPGKRVPIRCRNPAVVHSAMGMRERSGESRGTTS